MRKINIGCGSNVLSGWENYDLYPQNKNIQFLDASKPLPFEDESVDFIFNEHIIEHISQKEGYNFLQECKRVLKPDGVLRVTTPSLVRIHQLEDDAYRQFQKTRGWGDGTKGCGVKAIIFNHGHQCVYSESLLQATMESVGFKNVILREVGQSDHPDLKNVEGHGRAITDRFNNLESFCVEGTK